MERKRNPLQRFYGRNDLHFITFSCYRGRRYLGTIPARNRFVKILDEVRSRFQFHLIGYVVMPEHVHLLVAEPAKGDLSVAMQVLKQRVSRSLRKRNKSSSKQMKLSFVREEEVSPPAFWQRRFYDFNIWNEKKLREKLIYMHGNPVKRKLVKHPRMWPWSSWSFYEEGEEGVIRIDVLNQRLKDPGDQSQNESQRQNPHPYKPKGAAPKSVSALNLSATRPAPTRQSCS